MGLWIRKFHTDGVLLDVQLYDMGWQLCVMWRDKTGERHAFPVKLPVQLVDARNEMTIDKRQGEAKKGSKGGSGGGVISKAGGTANPTSQSPHKPGKGK